MKNLTEYPYLIAEIGINHNGSINIAKELIKQAALNGADAVKFQKRNIENTFTKEHLQQPYNKPYSFGKTYGEHKAALEFSDSQLEELYNYTKEFNIDFLCSGFDITAFDFINNYVNIHKIPSPFVNHHELLKHVANYGKPVILSTGMHTLEEIEQAVNVVKPINDDLILLHCVTAYPVLDKEVSLAFIQTLKDKFNTLVGYSSHDEGIIIPACSVLYGASVIEKHFTLDKDMAGPDHKASITPSELQELRINLDRIQDSIGGSNKILTTPELEAKNKYGVSWTTSRFINKGEAFTQDNTCIKCPGTGISPLINIYNHTAVCDLAPDTTIKEFN